VKTDFNLAEAAAKSSFVHFESFLYMLIFSEKPAATSLGCVPA